MKIEIDHIDESVVTLDTYNSDLNLVIDASKYSAHPLTKEGFAFMWAGARATHGADKGKFCFELKIIEHLDVSHLPADEPNPHVVRVGFSVDSTSMQLGEDPLSYGYGGTGKISTNCQFKDFGPPFAAGDVVLAVVNMDSDPVQIGFARNGNFVGWAYKVRKADLKSKALFPHVLTKNCSFEVNYGQKDEPYFKPPEAVKDFTFIACLPVDQRVCGTRPPEKREDCEMIMMCGLPGAGKSVWAADYSLKNPDKKYNVLGTNNIIDKMKVMGLPRKRNYAGRWDVLIQMATKCLNTMFSIGSKLRRNYVLDQTNVYPTAQRRKMRNFDGFNRRAVVVVPSDVEYKRRCDKRDREEGKEVPDSAVLEMKANFKIPEENDIFNEIIFTELQRNEAESLVRKYNEEGKAATGPARKQFRSNEPMKGGYDSGKGNFGFNKSEQDMQGGPNSYGGNYGYGRGGYQGGDNYNDGPGGFDSRGSGYDSFQGGRGGFDNGRGGRGGYDNGRGGRGGYDNGRGGRGGFDRGRGGRGSFDSGRGGRGGFDSSRGGRGGYDSSSGGRSGYDSGLGGRSDYDGSSGGRGSYDRGSGGRGGYDSSSGGRGGYDSSSRGRGGYDSGSGGRGGYDSSSGGRGGYDSGSGGRSGYDSGSGGRSGYDSTSGGRGGYDSGRGGRGGYESDRGGRGGFESSRGRGSFDSQGGRGGFDSNRGGRGGYDSRGGRGGYDNNRGGRGSYDSSSGGRGGYESGRGGRGGYDSSRGGRGGYDSNRGGRGSYDGRSSSDTRSSFDSYGTSGRDTESGNYADSYRGYKPSQFEQAGEGAYGSSSTRESTYGSSGYNYGSNTSGSDYRRGSSSTSYQRGSQDTARGGSRDTYGSESSHSKDASSGYYSKDYSYDSAGSGSYNDYSKFGNASGSYSAGTAANYYSGAQTVKSEPTDRYSGSTTDTSSKFSAGSGYSGQTRATRWGAELPQTASTPTAAAAAPTYTAGTTGGYTYQQGMSSTPAQPWTGTESAAGLGQASYTTGQTQWSQYAQPPPPPSSYQYYSQ